MVLFGDDSNKDKFSKEDFNSANIFINNKLLDKRKKIES